MVTACGLHLPVSQLVLALFLISTKFEYFFLCLVFVHVLEEIFAKAKGLFFFGPIGSTCGDSALNHGI